MGLEHCQQYPLWIISGSDLGQFTPNIRTPPCLPQSTNKLSWYSIDGRNGEQRNPFPLFMLLQEIQCLNNINIMNYNLQTTCLRKARAFCRLPLQFHPGLGIIIVKNYDISVIWETAHVMTIIKF